MKATATGDWAGQDNNIAYCIDGGWRFYAPFAGLIAHVADEDVLIVYTGSSWEDISSLLTLDNLAKLGINTTADSTNKLAVKSAAILFDNIGGDVQTKLNKHAASDTASFLFQTNYSGRAEIGLTGNDNFHFKVSPDGSAWTDALVLDKTTGLATLAADPTSALHAATKQYVDGRSFAWGVPIATWTFSAAVANVDFTSLSAYRELLLIGFGLQHDSGSNATLQMLLSSDNGSTFFSTNYDNFGSGAVTSYVQLSATVANTVVYGFEAELCNFNDASYRTLVRNASYQEQSTTNSRSSLGVRTVAEADNALRVKCTAGNLAAGNLFLFGRK